MTNQQKLLGVQRFMALIPHCKALNMQAEAVTDEGVLLSLEASSPFVGNAQRQLIHGGVLSVLMDTACGSAAIMQLPEPEVCPTIDLRLDHYRPATQGRKIYCRAWVTRLARQIVFTEGLIWQDEAEPLVKGTGTFMRLGGERTPKGFARQLFGEQGDENARE
ncbi:PaaI family thioesterase [Marinospirillum perlucidum]|uniref:PaaI family thioesterase n=1 Tax=Marinospirillum perlucidum TaxID=1982602 RepID=UPI000DF15296|nr:PaaI family thioesterase [Marinospirillum perlucidum]